MRNRISLCSVFAHMLCLLAAVKFQRFILSFNLFQFLSTRSGCFHCNVIRLSDGSSSISTDLRTPSNPDQVKNGDGIRTLTSSLKKKPPSFNEDKSSLKKKSPSFNEDKSLMPSAETRPVSQGRSKISKFGRTMAKAVTFKRTNSNSSKDYSDSEKSSKSSMASKAKPVISNLWKKVSRKSSNYRNSKGSGSSRNFRSPSRSNSSFSHRSDGRLSRQRSRDFIDALCPEDAVPPPAPQERQLSGSRQILSSEFSSLRDAVCRDGPPGLPKDPIKFLTKVDELKDRLCPEDSVPPRHPWALTEDAGHPLATTSSGLETPPMRNYNAMLKAWSAELAAQRTPTTPPGMDAPRPPTPPPAELLTPDQYPLIYSSERLRELLLEVCPDKPPAVQNQGSLSPVRSPGRKSPVRSPGRKSPRQAETSTPHLNVNLKDQISKWLLEHDPRTPTSTAPTGS